jgi:hypothetical protein
MRVTGSKGEKEVQGSYGIRGMGNKGWETNGMENLRSNTHSSISTD